MWIDDGSSLVLLKNKSVSFLTKSGKIHMYCHEYYHQLYSISELNHENISLHQFLNRVLVHFGCTFIVHNTFACYFIICSGHDDLIQMNSLHMNSLYPNIFPKLTSIHCKTMYKYISPSWILKDLGVHVDISTPYYQWCIYILVFLYIFSIWGGQ